MSYANKKVLLIEGAVNLLMVLTKFSVGLVTGSFAILADAMHSFIDVANNGIALMAIHIAERPPDKNHPYGHQKFEQLAVFGLASLLTIVAFELALGAIERFGHPVKQSLIGLAVLTVTLCINIILTVWEQYWAKRLDSAILHADASHTMSDVLSSLTVIAGWQLAAHGYYWLDTVFAFIVSVIIFVLAFKLFQRAVPILVDQTGLDPAIVTYAVNDITNVTSVRRVRSRFSGKSLSADIVVTVDPLLSTAESHLVADKVEKVLREKFDIHDVVVHIEPHAP